MYYRGLTYRIDLQVKILACFWGSDFYKKEEAVVNIMSGKKHTPKLNSQQKDWILSQLAIKTQTLKTFQSIADLFKEVWDESIRHTTVQYYNDHYKDKIYEIRKHLNNEIPKLVSIANPIVQMKYLEDILEGCMNPPNDVLPNGKEITAKPLLKEARETIKLAAQLSGNFVEKTENTHHIGDSELLKGIDFVYHQAVSNE